MSRARDPKSNRDQDPSGSPGEGHTSFWTSYSDLLLGLSVIFLVLFFVSVLRTGITQRRNEAESARAQALLEGKTPSSALEKSKAAESALEQTREEIARRRTALEQSAQEVAKTLEAIDEQSKAVESLMKDQNLKSAQLELLREKTTQLETQLGNLEKSRHDVEQKLADKDISQTALKQALSQLTSERERLSRQLAAVQDEIQSRDQTLQERETLLRDKTLRIATLEKDLQLEKSRLETLRQEHLALQTQNATLENRGQQLTESNQGLLREGESLRSTKLGLAEELAGVQKENAALRSRLVFIETTFGELKKEHERLGKSQDRSGSALALLEQERDGLRGRITELNRELETAKKDSGGNQKKLALCEETLARASDTRFESPSISTLSRQLAEARADLQALGRERKAIATALGDSLKKKGIDAKVHPDSGVITLDMDETFRFRNGSAELTPEAREKLRSVIPIYAEKLFTGHSATRLSRISITGYASPRYFKQYVDPKEQGTAAARLNQKLSEERARQIADYIVSSEVGDYPYRDRMKELIQTSGVGHTRPLRAPAGQRPIEACGPYDCSRSRRVELNFHLVGEKEESSDESSRKSGKDR